MIDLFKRRRSIRKFVAKAVDDRLVELLLEAAMAAPSAHGRQSTQFVVVRREETRNTLAEIHEYADACRTAPLVIVVCAEPRKSPHYVADACVAAENILLAAVALGLGAVWVAAYPYDNHQAFARGVLDIPDEIAVLCLIPVGYPAEQKAARTRFDPAKIHYEQFRPPTSG